jgi:hypothetical protein
MKPWQFVLNTLAVIMVLPVLAVVVTVMFFWDLWRLRKSTPIGRGG